MQSKSAPMPLDLNNIWSGLLAAIQKQGLSFMLLAVAVYYFYQRDLSQNKRIDECTNQVIQYLAEDRKILIDAVNKNTRTLEQIHRDLAGKEPLIQN